MLNRSGPDPHSWFSISLKISISTGSRFNTCLIISSPSKLVLSTMLPFQASSRRKMSRNITTAQAVPHTSSSQWAPQVSVSLCKESLHTNSRPRIGNHALLSRRTFNGASVSEVHSFNPDYTVLGRIPRQVFLCNGRTEREEGVCLLEHSYAEIQPFGCSGEAFNKMGP
ncbi:hypothetical protein P280DRAFT_240939 [Massarina eburnea CBS 473.64]|uniref:Uncharacterized protein n=1 Tax=Massarina eburnea CBS 473.64 TaxID=1395130 RepID=A0A6A6S6R1_9PLEO|nr:hypothetical protein P280DRAFT_240939 [Massarina eburnea CBS 473.64]